MCGISGLYSTLAGGADASIVERMTAVQSHRGPDDAGFAAFVRKAGRVEAVDSTRGVDKSDVVAALGHRRLSIVDLSPAGHQPMATPERDVWITFNGEIYNFEDLRRELEALGRTFRSRSDTEVLLHAYVEWGPAFVERLNGIFAFGILDLREQESPRLFLARDRLGVKPLYYARAGADLVFASELKGILEHPGVPRRLSASALNQYLAFLWVPEPRTILADVHKLPPGHWMLVEGSRTTTEAYWKLRFEPTEGGTEAERARELAATLERACVRQMMADVPVGALLSGGVDSTAVVALLAKAGTPPARVFTVGFTAEDQRFEGFSDDVAFAEKVAADLKIPISATRLSPDLAERLPKLVWHLDEPLADPAILPLYEMCVAARKDGIKVLLSGMAADEIFGGYRRHAAAPLVQHYLRLPARFRRGVLLGAAERLPSAGVGRLAPTFRRLKRFLRGVEHESGSPYVGLAMWTTEAERRALFSATLRERLAGASAWTAHADAMARAGAGSLLTKMVAGDTALYLPSHNLNYTDKIGMAASVEVRVPFLDNDVVDFATRLPDRMRVRRGETKRILRDAVRGVVPEDVLRRRKAGLGAPIRAWLVGPLRGLLDEHLSRERVRERGLFDADEIARAREALESGRDDTSYLLWALLVLEMWMSAYGVREVATS